MFCESHEHRHRQPGARPAPPCPAFDAGDRLRVHFQVIEGTRRRTQVFEGVVIKRQGHGARETSPSASSRSASASSGPSRCIRRRSSGSRSRLAATCGAPSCTTCVTASASALASASAARPDLRNVSSANCSTAPSRWRRRAPLSAAGDGSVAAAPVSVPEPSGSVAGEPSGVAAGAATDVSASSDS